MAVEFRKTFRTFYKLTPEEQTMLVIENKQYGSNIKFLTNYPYIDGVLLDPEYKPCTEEEFESARKEAYDRITLQKIL